MWRYRFVLPSGILSVFFVLCLASSCTNPSSSCQSNDDCTDNLVCRNRVCSKSSGKGCQNDIDCSNGRRCELTTGLCVECLKDTDCDTLRRCVNQRCTNATTDGGSESVELPEFLPESKVCRADTDCSPEQTCNLSSGKCIPKQGNQCKSDNDCAGDKYCVSGSCVPGRRTCQDNAGCQGGFDCRSGFCYRGKCQSNNDCPAGEACDTLKQQCGPANAQDCTQTGCPSGQVCNSTTKQCGARQNCTQTGCAAGETCNPSTRLCEPASPQDCTQRACPSGQKCNTTTKRCEAARSNCTSDSSCIPPHGSCRSGRCINCSQSGCPTNKWCNISTGRCIDTPPPCSVDKDCPAPRGSCLNGGCLSCASQFICPSGQICNQATGLCGKPPCTSDNDCPAPSGSCQTGVCQTCARDFTCASGQQCENSTGRCRTLPPPCTSNRQCTSPYGTCRGGKCESCRNFSCPSGQQCNTLSGLCYTPTKTCRKDSDCSSPNGTCRFGRCASCTAFSCSSGTTCNTTTGLCKGCSKDSECKSPNGWCRSRRCTTCRFYSCSGGLQCNYTSGRCEPRTCTSHRRCQAPRGACYQGKCQTCNGDFACSSKQICDKVSGLCQPKPECVRHSDCRSDQLCLSERCVPYACDKLNACPDGQQCIHRRCVPVYGLCYSYLCAATDRCLRGPDKKDVCYARCGVGGTTCPGGQECLSVKLIHGEKGHYCFPKATLASGSRCTLGLLHARCKNNGVCVKTSSFSSYAYCHDRCIPGSSQGCSSRKECVALSPGKGLCFDKGTRSKGSFCGMYSSRCSGQYVCLPSSTSSTSGRCVARCTALGSGGISAGCATKESCISSPYSKAKGVCAPEGTRSEGYRCKPFSTIRCKVGLVCEPDPLSTSGEGLCRKRCLSDSNCSGRNDICSQGICLPKPTGKEGSSCRYSSSLSSSFCVQGLLCRRESSSTSTYGTCQRVCKSNSDCTSSTYPECSQGYCQRKGTQGEQRSCSTSSSYRCKAGLTCITASFSGRCLKTCRSDSDCSSSYPDCFAGYCLAKGTLAEGSYCRDSFLSRCVSPLRCARPPTSSFASRRCLRSCTSNAHCTGTYKKCSKSSDGGMVCYK